MESADPVGREGPLLDRADIGGEGNPITKQVETAGDLPRLTMEARRGRLHTAPGEFDYIGAILSAFADLAATSKHKFKMRCLPLILTNIYQAQDLTS
jgi:hypothetical protein